MTPAPARTLLASALSLTALLTVSACSALTSPPVAEPRPIVVSPTAEAPGASPAAAGALTEAQAQAALLTQADLGDAWTPTQGAATWRDSLLKATANAPDCKRLLDTVYTEDLFGADARPRAVVGLDDDMDEAQLRYQVLGQRPADVNRTLNWLRTLPRKCGQFTAKTAQGSVEAVQVTEAELPAVGDARQGLRLTLTSENADGELTGLTVDIAAVRIGDDAIVLTNGGLGDVSSDVTQAAVQLGAQRLTEVRKQGRVQV